MTLLSVDADFNAKLEEIGEFYRQKGVCAGDDCYKFMVQVITNMLD